MRRCGHECLVAEVVLVFTEHQPEARRMRERKAHVGLRR